MPCISPAYGCGMYFSRALTIGLIATWTHLGTVELQKNTQDIDKLWIWDDDDKQLLNFTLKIYKVRQVSYKTIVNKKREGECQPSQQRFNTWFVHAFFMLCELKHLVLANKNGYHKSCKNCKNTIESNFFVRLFHTYSITSDAAFLKKLMS